MVVAAAATATAVQLGRQVVAAEVQRQPQKSLLPLRREAAAGRPRVAVFAGWM